METNTKKPTRLRWALFWNQASVIRSECGRFFVKRVRSIGGGISYMIFDGGEEFFAADTQQIAKTTCQNIVDVERDTMETPSAEH